MQCQANVIIKGQSTWETPTNIALAMQTCQYRAGEHIPAIPCIYKTHTHMLWCYLLCEKSRRVQRLLLSPGTVRHPEQQPVRRIWLAVSFWRHWTPRLCRRNATRNSRSSQIWTDEHISKLKKDDGGEKDCLKLQFLHTVCWFKEWSDLQVPGEASHMPSCCVVSV